MVEHRSANINIAFDESHQERGKLNTSLTQLYSILANNGYNCIRFAEFPITLENLEPYDIIVFACPDNSKFSREEISDIVKWVKRGRGLLMLSHAGGDKGRRSNLSELAEQFGIIFENDQVLDRVNNLGVENLPTISNFPVPHPITENLKEICYRAGCSLSISSSGITPVISSGPHSNPIESPLILAGEIEAGRICGIGSYEMFRDRISGGIGHVSHEDLIMNIMNWLNISNRQIMGAIEQPQAMNTDNTVERKPARPYSPPKQKIADSGSQILEKTFESEIKIHSTENLFNAFEDILTDFISLKERMQTEFDNLQSNIMNLIRSIIATEDEMININELKAKVAQYEAGKWSEINGLNEIDDNGDDHNNHFKNEEMDPATLAALESLEKFQKPPIDEHLSKSSNTKIDQANIQQIKEEPQKIISTNQAPTTITEKTPEELEAELDSLENKLKSIENLTSFVEKKFAAGKLNQKNYDRQISKLNKDKKNTQKKINQIREDLGQ